MKKILFAIMVMVCCACQYKVGDEVYVESRDYSGHILHIAHSVSDCSGMKGGYSVWKVSRCRGYNSPLYCHKCVCPADAKRLEGN